MNKVILAGGSGYIGSVLADFYTHKSNEVVVIGRTSRPPIDNIRTVTWDGKNLGDWSAELEGADLLINLTGKNVNCRYNEKNKNEILRSRLDATRVLGQAFQKLSSPPKVWIQIASATIYRHAEDRIMDESTGETGEGFSVEVCKAWEKKFWEQETPLTRKVLLRTSIVLGKAGGAFPRLVNMVRAGLGGKQGNGRQYISWIHEADVCSIIDLLYRNEHLQGTFNCTSPGSVSNTAFMKLMRNYAKVPLGLPAPAWLLTMGAWLIGTETELILKSRWVSPARLLQVGYVFRYPTLDLAMQDLLKSK